MRVNFDKNAYVPGETAQVGRLTCGGVSEGEHATATALDKTFCTWWPLIFIHPRTKTNPNTHPSVSSPSFPTACSYLILGLYKSYDVLHRYRVAYFILTPRLSRPKVVCAIDNQSTSEITFVRS